jgi:hypothetical protein
VTATGYQVGYPDGYQVGYTLRPMRPTRSLFFHLSFAAVALAACGPTQEPACGETGAPAACGMSCMADEDCGQGTYCGSGHACTADCLVQGSACPSNGFCDERGRCSPDAGVGTCVGWACQVNKACAGGAKTTITGKVYAPNGTLPLYNAAVFVPNGAVNEITPGVTCDRCDGKLTGNPIAVAATKADGSFTLTDVPTGTNVPVVIQMGRWRRQITVPTVADCAVTTLDDPAMTHLPARKTEGHIPQIAIASGKADAFECLLLKIGVDPAEITAPSGTGRIHFFRATDGPGLDLSPSAPSASELYSSLDNLLKYDVLLLPCEAQPYDKGHIGPFPLNPDPRALLSQYVDAGGRIFATHYSYDWLTYPGSPYNKVATNLTFPFGTWPVQQPDDYDHTIAAALVTTFPKGMEFAKWLLAAGAASAMNTLNIVEGRSDVIGVDPNYAQPWATYNFSSTGGGPAVMHFTFNTPLDAPKNDMGGADYCGRVVFSDFHVTAGAVDAMNPIFPGACKSSEPMSDQEKALAFMLFDLSSCVQPDAAVPIL